MGKIQRNLTQMFKKVQHKIDNEKKNEKRKIRNKDPKTMHEIFKKQTYTYKSVV